MTRPFVPRPGAVFSADIAVPEHAREVAFYGRVLSTGASPLWRQDDLMNNVGLPVIGLGAASPEYASLPLQWMPHLQVTDVAASAQRAVDGGGRILMQSEDGSAWAVLLDPEGAAFGLVPIPTAMAQVAAALPDPPAGPVGRIAWIDQTVAAPDAACRYYADVLGCVAGEAPDGIDAAWVLHGEDGTPVAGFREAGGDEAVPPVWMLHLPVGDLDESLRRVDAGGGRRLGSGRGPSGSVVYVVDPVGAAFALCRTAPPEEP